MPDSGKPDGDPRRVLRAPIDGILATYANIGDQVAEGQMIAEVESNGNKKEAKISSPFKGVLRGLARSGMEVKEGYKLGDVDERNDPSACFTVSDKALAMGGAVLEAVLIKLKEMEQPLF
jgi:xanthine dehydrogenase accessory factor